MLNDANSRNAGTKDPVCGMEIEALASNMLEHDGRVYFFCSDACKSKFKADPEKYISQVPAETGTMHQHAQHTHKHGCC